MDFSNERPDPDELLASLKLEEEKSKRGKLKIFFGMCAGVGKTYTMLETALAEALQKHTPISISGIVARPRTGEILALATLPNFDPNNPGASPVDARRNRVIADVSEPGSTPAARAVQHRPRLDAHLRPRRPADRDGLPPTRQRPVLP